MVQLERKVRTLEQEKSLETTEGTLTSLRNYLNHSNNAFDRFEVLDLLYALVHLARTKVHHKADEYAAALEEVRARWDSLNSSELQRLSQSEDREGGGFNLKVLKGRCSRMVEHPARQVEVGVEALSDSLVCGLRC